MLFCPVCSRRLLAQMQTLLRAVPGYYIVLRPTTIETRGNFLK